MLIETLDLLRCPFCGSRLAVVENAALSRTGDRIESGVLGCACCAFPVVAGIPVLIADDPTRAAMHALEAGRRNDALHMLLGLDGARLDAFGTLIAGPRTAPYRDLLAVLCLDAEADCFLYRFSDPTYLTVEAMLDGLGHGDRRRAPGGAGTLDGPEAPAGPGASAGPGHDTAAAGRALDLCGGSGHLTRVLLRQPTCAGAVLADLHFWKLWLAARITAPGCAPVCCDANSPLPFADDRFSTVLLSDAFPYIWHKRMLAGEMRRVAARDGVVVLPHLHSADGENYSAGDTLSPAAYRDLFAPLEPRLFDDRTLVAGVIDARVADLTRHVGPADLGTAPSVTLVATRNAGLFRRYEVPDRLDVTGVLAINPLYRVDYAGGVSRLTRTFPTPEYEDEFALAKRYLPATVVVEADLRGEITPALIGPDYAALRRRRVLLDTPRRYC